MIPHAIVQNAYLVPDIEAACERLNRVMGLGPFIGGTEGTLADHIYRGQAADPIRIRGVFVQSGDLNIELVQVLSEAPSAFHDMLADARGGGLHHCALFSDDYEATKARYVEAGYPVASEFGFAGRRICYVDTRPLLGHMIEIYPDLPLIRAMYGEARDAARDRPGAMTLTPFTTPR